MRYLKKIAEITMLMLLVLNIPVSAEPTFYMYRDKKDNNRVYITNVPKKTDMTIVVHPYRKSRSRNLHEKINEWIKYYAEMYRLSPALIKAMVRVESNFNHHAVSNKGAQGLMQLMPVTAKEMGVKEKFSPRENIKGGVKYFRHLMNRFHRTDLALAAYNAGPQKVIDAGYKIPDIPETKNYVKQVLQKYRTYNRYLNQYPRRRTTIIPVKNKEGKVVISNIVESKK